MSLISEANETTKVLGIPKVFVSVILLGMVAGVTIYGYRTLRKSKYEVELMKAQIADLNSQIAERKGKS